MNQTTSQNSNGKEIHPLIRIALLEEKVAQLEQRLNILEELKTGEPAGSIKPIPSLSEHNKLFDIVKIDARIVESNDTWSKFAWKLELRSQSNEPIGFNVTIEFLDQDGFVVDDTLDTNLFLPANEEKSYSGYTLINAHLVENIASIQAKVNPL